MRWGSFAEERRGEKPKQWNPTFTCASDKRQLAVDEAARTKKMENGSWIPNAKKLA